MKQPHRVKSLLEHIFIQSLTALNDSAAGGKRGSGPVSNIHQIYDFSHRTIAKGGHPNDKPNHGFKGKFTFTQSNGIGQGECLLDKLRRNKVGESTGALRSGGIDDAEGLENFYLKRVP